MYSIKTVIAEDPIGPWCESSVCYGDLIAEELPSRARENGLIKTRQSQRSVAGVIEADRKHKLIRTAHEAGSREPPNGPQHSRAPRNKDRRRGQEKAKQRPGLSESHSLASGTTGSMPP